MRIRERGVIMHRQCLVAVYPSRNEAAQAVRAALGSGIPNDHIRISSAQKERSHVWDWLFSRHVPERDKSYYRTHLEEGRTALSVLLDGDTAPARINAVEELLERYHPVDVHIEEEEETISTSKAFTSKASTSKASTSTEAAAGKTVKAQVAVRTGEEEIIPLPREELKVGTRATDRVRHIRTYVVEEPVEKEVSLSDEQLIVERRPATRTAAAGEPAERDYEFHERHEEPIVEKSMRADEELVIRKEAKQHTERLRGTVRRTEARVVEDLESKERQIVESKNRPMMPRGR
jgi:hypothetical protein